MGSREGRAPGPAGRRQQARHQRRRAWAAVLLTVVLCPAVGAAQSAGQLPGILPGSLSGQWTLNRGESQFPREIGFSIDGLMRPGSRGPQAAGKRPDSELDLGAMLRWRQSEEDARRRQVLTAEVRMPPLRLTITDTPDAVTFTDEHGRSRTFYPHGREVPLLLDGVQGITTASRETSGLIVQYKVEATRFLRYRFTRLTSPDRLSVEVTFVEKGGGDVVTRIYDATSLGDAQFAMRGPYPPPPPGIARPDRLVLPGADGAAGGGAEPAGADGPPMQGADAALRGLSRIGLVVEGLGASAGVCGLTQEALEAAMAKPFAGAGLTVRKHTDDDTYLYINVTTDHEPGGLCVSRYDAGLYSMTTAKLTHQTRPALVEVALLRKGGLVGTDAPEHAATVTRGLLAYLEQFIAQIRAANR